MATTARQVRQTVAAVDPAAVEQRIRHAVGWVLLTCGALEMVAVAWDSTYHTSVGRHKFLTPPHWLLYGGVAIAGLACLYVIFNDTLRHRHGRAVHDYNSVQVFRIFHAPIGILLAGFGLLTMVISGPLDNYWHTIYGIFVHPWTPFHMMVQLGGGIWGLGNIYLWSAMLLARRADVSGSDRTETWGLIGAVMLMLRLVIISTYPGMTLFQTARLGPLQFMTYPVLLAASIPWLLFIAVTVTRRRHAALLAGVLLVGLALGIQILIPWVVRLEAAMEGREFLSAALVPRFNLSRLAPDFAVLLAAVALSAALWRRWPNRWQSAVLLGAAQAVPLWLVGAVSAGVAAEFLAKIDLPPGIDLGPLSQPIDGLAALPLAICAGMVSGLLGYMIALGLRSNTR